MDYKIGERYANYPDMNPKEFQLNSTNNDLKITKK